MGNLVPESEWGNVPHFEADAVLTGGPDCPDNIPIQALLNRTEWLNDNKQAASLLLTALAGLVTVADRMVYFTGDNQPALAPISAFIRTLLDDGDAYTALGTLGAAPLASPALTGTPTAPTAATATNTTQLANTAYVVARIAQDIAGKANLASPALTGTPTAPTAAAGTNTTQLANCAFVQAAVAALSTLAGSSDIAFSALANNHVLQYDSASAKWVNRTLAAAGIAALASPGLTGTPTAPTAAAGTNTAQLATTAFVQAAVAALVNSSPTALDTLNELAAAINNDANFASGVASALASKAPLASPALTGTPTAPTPAQFDASTKLATMAAVQRALGSYRLLSGFSANAVLDTSHVGGVFWLHTAGTTLTLPASTGLANGATITFVSNNTGDVDIVASGTDTVRTSWFTASSVTVGANQYITLIADGTGGWYFVDTNIYDLIPSVPKSATYTLKLSDIGKSIDFTGGAGQTIWVPKSADLAFPVGATITITNNTTNSLNIAIDADTMRMAGTANTGVRTLTQFGVATMRKVSATAWIISGSGLL